MGIEFKVRKNKMFWRWIEMMVAHNVHVLNATVMYILPQSKKISGPGAVAHTCVPSTLRDQGGRIRRSRHRDHRGEHRNPIATKNIKMSWVLWQVPVVPASREAEAGELPKPRRQWLG